MSSIILVISDLHLAGGDHVFDGFSEESQSALEGLLAAANPRGPLGRAGRVELVINGDCFDFLATSPFEKQTTIDASVALEKMRLIAAAHPAFFETLRGFLAHDGHRITFTTGNHDIELRFAEIRAFIAQAIGCEDDQRLAFCPERFYQPLPDIYIEHGNQFDFWNRALPGIWDEQGQLLDPQPRTIALCPGSRYFQYAATIINRAYPYFDHLEPSMNILRQMALLCLFNPAVVRESVQGIVELIAEPYQALAHLAAGEEHNPVRLFQETMVDFAAFQSDMERRFGGSSGAAASEQARANVMLEFSTLQETLKLPLTEAVAAICTPMIYQMGEDVARGMHGVLRGQSDLRYAIAGHTHAVRIEPVHDKTQSYLNTGSWTSRYALPAPGEVTPALVEWLRRPDWSAVPLRDVTQRVFIFVEDGSDEKQAQQTSSSATLCVWEGGHNGNYKVLA